MKNLRVILFFTFICSLSSTLCSNVLAETERFKNKGEWVIIQPLMVQMGSLLSFIYNTICFKLSITDYLSQIVCNKFLIFAEK